MAKAFLSRSGMHMCHLSMTLVLTWIEFVTGKKEITDSVCCTLIHLEHEMETNKSLKNANHRTVPRALSLTILRPLFA